MKNIVLLIILGITINGCLSNKNKTKDLSLIENKGLNEISIYQSTIKTVKDKFGDRFNQINWAKDQTEIRYKNLGVSFHYDQNNKLQTINFISINPNRFRGATSKGLKIKKNLLLKDVINIYGNPDWSYTSDSTELSADYDGISFYVKTDKDFTKKNFSFEQADNLLHTNFYLNKEIWDISIPY
jgi:hypothetical protein